MQIHMLWEQADAMTVLNRRFGFPDPSTASDWARDIISDLYGIDHPLPFRLTMSDQNALLWCHTDTRDLILKWSIAPHTFQHLAEVAHITRLLADRQIPVAAPLLDIQGNPQVEVAGASLCLMPVIKGELLHVNAEQEVRSAGRTLARLHLELDKIAPTVTGSLPSSPIPLPDQLKNWISTAPAHIPDTLLRLLQRLCDATHGIPPTQIVHGDYRSANIICANHDVAAVLDFERAEMDHAIVDLTRAAVLLATQYRDWAPLPPTSRTWLRQGYESVRPLSKSESSWWDALVLWWTLRFIPEDNDTQGWLQAAMSQA